MTNARLMNLSELDDEELVDKYVVARLLGLSPRTVSDKASRRELPLYKIDGRIRFKVRELREWRNRRKLH